MFYSPHEFTGIRKTIILNNLREQINHTEIVNKQLAESESIHEKLQLMLNDCSEKISSILDQSKTIYETLETAGKRGVGKNSQADFARFFFNLAKNLNYRRYTELVGSYSGAIYKHVDSYTTHRRHIMGCNLQAVALLWDLDIKSEGEMMDEKTFEAIQRYIDTQASTSSAICNCLSAIAGFDFATPEIQRTAKNALDEMYTTQQEFVALVIGLLAGDEGEGGNESGGDGGNGVATNVNILRLQNNIRKQESVADVISFLNDILASDISGDLHGLRDVVESLDVPITRLNSHFRDIKRYHDLMDIINKLTIEAINTLIGEALNKGADENANKVKQRI